LNTLVTDVAGIGVMLLAAGQGVSGNAPMGLPERSVRLSRLTKSGVPSGWKA
jgi:hypothetical protein